MEPSSTHKHIFDLPTELLAYIFTFIPYDQIDDVSQVCSRFKEIGNIALRTGFNWVRRQTASLICRLENEEEDQEMKKKERRRRQSNRSKTMEMYWRYRRYQSFIIIICLTRLFVATFSSLISVNVYPICSGSLIDLYCRALRKTRTKPTFIAKMYQKAIQDQTLSYKALCESVLLKCPKIERSAVLRTILESLQCFPLKDTSMTIEGRHVHYTCSLPGSWLQIFRHNDDDSSNNLNTFELVLVMHSLYYMLTSNIAQCSGAEYLIDTKLTDPLLHWRAHSIYCGTTGYAPCYMPLVFEFLISCDSQFMTSSPNICDIESDEFKLKISTPVHACLRRQNEYARFSVQTFSKVTSYIYQTPILAEPMDTSSESTVVPVSCFSMPVCTTRRKRLRLVSSYSSLSEAKQMRMSM